MRSKITVTKNFGIKISTLGCLIEGGGEGEGRLLIFKFFSDLPAPY